MQAYYSLTFVHSLNTSRRHYEPRNTVCIRFHFYLICTGVLKAGVDMFHQRGQGKRKQHNLGQPLLPWEKSFPRWDSNPQHPALKTRADSTYCTYIQCQGCNKQLRPGSPHVPYMHVQCFAFALQHVSCVHKGLGRETWSILPL